MSRRWHQHSWLAYAVSAAAVTASFAMRAALTPFLGHGSVFLIYEPAIAMVAFMAGTLPALSAIVLSTALGLVQIASHDPALRMDHYFQAALHVVCGLAIILISQNWRRGYLRLFEALHSYRETLSEVRASEAEFRLQSSQLTLALEAGQLGTWQYDFTTKRLSGSNVFWTSMGLAEPDRNLRGIRNIVDPERFGELASMLWQPKGILSPSIDKDIEVRLPDGSSRVINLRGQIRKSPGARILVGVSADITLRRQAENTKTLHAQDRILIDELVHRIKNLFPVILSIVRLTGKHSNSVADFQKALTKRLRVLEATHSLLAQNINRTASINELVLLELAPFKEDGRVRSRGSSILLMDGAAESFSMIVHELATNSVKHGALARPEGRLNVKWALKSEDVASPMIFEWIESNASPPLDQIRAGYGLSIIGATGHPLIGDSASLEFTSDGMRYALTIPRGKFSIGSHTRPTEH